MKLAPSWYVLPALAAGLAGGYFWGVSNEAGTARAVSGWSQILDRSDPGYPHGFSDHRLAKAGNADSLTGMMSHAAALPPADLEALLRQTRRDAVPGEAEAMLRQHLLLHLLASADSARALRVAREFDLRGDGTARALVLAAMAERDPSGAAALVSAGSGLAMDTGAALAASGVAAAWARQDAAGAQAWVRTLPEGLGSEAWSAVAAVLASSDPAAAAAFAMEMPAGASRAHGAARVAEIWARAAPSEALTWASSLEKTEKFTAVPAALTALAESDPAAAAGWLVRQPPGDHLPQNTAALMGTWARSEPAAAARWVAGLPAGPVQTESMQHLLYAWTASAPEQASEWLHHQPESPGRDEAAAMLSLQVSATDPEAAALWASFITDPARRAAELHRSLSAWLRRDHAAASAWMQESGVTIP